MNPEPSDVAFTACFARDYGPGFAKNKAAYYSIVFATKKDLMLDRISPDGSSIESAFANHIRANYEGAKPTIPQCLFPMKTRAEMLSDLDRQKVTDKEEGFRNIQTDWTYRQ